MQASLDRKSVLDAILAGEVDADALIQEKRGPTVMDAVLSGQINPDALIEAKRAPTLGERVQGAGMTLGGSLANAVFTGNAGLMEFEAKALETIGLDSAAALVREAAQTMVKAGQGAAGAAQEAVPQLENQGFIGKALTQYGPQGLGSALGMAATPGLKGIRAGAISRGAIQGFGQGFYEAKAAGADEGTAWASGLANLGIGASEGLLGAQGRLGEILARVDKASGGGLKRVLWEGIKTGGAELTQEALQQAGSNLVAGALYDEDRRVFEQVIESGTGGALTGLLIGALAGGRRGGRVTTSPQGGDSSTTDAVVGDSSTTETVVHDSSSPEAQAAQAETPAQELELPIPPETVPESETPEPAPAAKPGLLERARAALAPSKAPSAEPEAPAGPVTTEEVEQVYGIKKAAVEEDFEAMGLPFPTKVATTSFVAEDEHAAKAFEEDPFVGKKLVDELARAPRARTGFESALLAREYTRVKLEQEAAQEAFFKARDDGRDATQEQANLDALRDEVFRVGEVGTQSSSTTAQGLALTRMMLREDFSLANMEREARVANDGKPLAQNQIAEVRALHQKIQEAQGYLDRYLKTADVAEMRRFTDDTIAEIAEGTRAAKKGGKVLDFLGKSAQAARERIKARGTRAMSGIDPFELADYAIVGAEYIARGVAKFSQWSNSMLKEFGDAVKPHLDSIFERAKEINSETPRLRAYKTRTRTRIEELRRKTAERNFVKQTREPLPLDEEALTLKTEVEKAKLEYRRALRKYEAEHRSTLKKAADTAQELVDINRDLITSLDFSAVGRQGLFFGVGHPVETAKQVAEMVRAALSEDYALRTDVRLRNRPGADFAKAAGLVLSDLNQDLGPREEFIRSRIAQKLPGLRHSNRAFITFINLQRAAMFDAIARSVPHGVPTIEQGRAIAFGVNAGSGRGSIKSMEGFITESGRLLWSPRLLLSRFQLITLQPVIRGDRHTRAAFAKEYARFLIGMSAIYSLASLADFELEDDPRSSDFGKIQIGNTRVDPLGGLAQVSTLIGRVATGEFVSIAGKERPLEAKDLFGFLRSKLTPALGLAIDLRLGKNIVNEPVTAADIPERLVFPLYFQDIKEAMEERGVVEGGGLGLLALFGWSVGTYGAKKAERAVAKP